MFLTRDDIFKAHRPTETIDVPVDEWVQGGVVRVRGLKAWERDQVDQVIVKGTRDGGKVHNLRSTVVVYGAINEDGTPLFTPEDIELLGEQSVAPVDRLYDAIQKLSSMDVEEMRKNSGKAQSKSLDSD